MATKKTGGKQQKSKIKITPKSPAKGTKNPPKAQNNKSPLPAQAKQEPHAKGLNPVPKAASKTPPRPKPKGTPKPKPQPTPAPVKKNTDRKVPVESGRYDVIRKILEIQKSRILMEAQGIVGDELNAEDALPDLGDRASAETDQNFTLRLRERGQNLVKKIDEAIERIDTGTFGVCEVCEGQIAIKRLTARPVTTLCIECKTDQERTERAKQ